MASEHAHQVTFVNWFRNEYDTLIFAIPNGGFRDHRTAQKLKAEGVVPGVPDLFIPKWNLWVEMKVEKGKLSKAQKEIIPQLENVIIGYGHEDARRKVKEFYEKNIV